MITKQKTEQIEKKCLERMLEKMESMLIPLCKSKKTYPTAYTIFVKIIPVPLTLVLSVLGHVSVLFKILSTLSLILTYVFIYADAKAQISEGLVICKEESEKSEHRSAKHLVDTVRHTHFLAHQVRDLCEEVKDITERDYRYLELFMELLNRTEQILSEFYGVAVSASIKIITDKTKSKGKNKTTNQYEVATIGRGHNNCTSRKTQFGIDLNDPHKYAHKTNVTLNYAYRNIIKNGNKNFICGDLTNIAAGKSKFLCEYKEWERAFLSTIIIPIRGPVSPGIELQSKKCTLVTRGLLCVDAPAKIADWNCTSNGASENLYAYNFCATIADTLFPVISKWVKEVEDSANANKG